MFSGSTTPKLKFASVVPYMRTTTTEGMFANAKFLDLDLPHTMTDPENSYPFLETASRMFYDTRPMNLNLGSLNVANASDISQMFYSVSNYDDGYKYLKINPEIFEGSHPYYYDNLFTESDFRTIDISELDMSYGSGSQLIGYSNTELDLLVLGNVFDIYALDLPDVSWSSKDYPGTTFSNTSEFLSAWDLTPMPGEWNLTR